ncbi:O-antigen ligase family protein [Anaerocolumna xylanovorans]|nr:O-antigen ligase family protein [Anaerocolumna xylanovorans]
MLLWLCVTASTLLVSNESLYASKTYLLSFICMFALIQSENWYKSIIKNVTIVSLVHVTATFFFFIVPKAYSLTMVKIWGSHVIGTLDGTEGYRAGLSSHYSTNGVFCSIPFLICGGLFFMGNVKRKQKKQLLVIMAVSIVAVLLTTKRAHLIFSILTLAICYYLGVSGQKINKVIKMLGTAVILGGLFLILMRVFPVLYETFNRFSESDDISTGRFDMWNLAWGLFKEHPIIGIGWGRYVHIMAGPLGINPDFATSVHNVYLQLLCEIGLVGFVIFLYAMLSCYIKTIQCLKSGALNDASYNALVVSYVLQTFVLLYNFTGNCIYDFTWYIYIIGCTLAISINHKMKKVKAVALAAASY